MHTHTYIYVYIYIYSDSHVPHQAQPLSLLASGTLSPGFQLWIDTSLRSTCTVEASPAARTQCQSLCLAVVLRAGRGQSRPWTRHSPEPAVPLEEQQQRAFEAGSHHTFFVTTSAFILMTAPNAGECPHRGAVCGAWEPQLRAGCAGMCAAQV